MFPRPDARGDALNAVAAERASIRLGGRDVLQDASFRLAPGEFVALLGANGSGKTTLLRAILGLVPLVSGTLEVFGASPTRGNAAIGYLPQACAAVAPRLRGRDLIAVAANGAGWGMPMPNRASRDEVARALRMVGAESLADRPAASLSGGQRQRLMLAQALLGRPRLLLLDEPLVSLDLPSQRDVVALAARICRELGAAVLFSAHELTPLVGHVDRVLYLGRGHAAIGTVEDVVTAPVLSRLYGGPVEVVHAAGRVFVVAAEATPDGRGH
jgi:zinc/manganese transport system ATP-binding protein